MKDRSIIFSEVPVGFVGDLLEEFYIADMINDIQYGDAGTYKFQNDIPEGKLKVDVYVNFTIEDEILRNSFMTYIKNYTDKKLKQYETLNKCWSLIDG